MEPPAEAAQTGVIDVTTPSASRPTAVNCCVAPIAKVTLGVTSMEAALPGTPSRCGSQANASKATADSRVSVLRICIAGLLAPV
ncbi:MAG: hypothetical protein C0503_10780 [Gemmatimonas sp.]|nr:hypothetical protein [Gemmatimonas sp.]